MNAVNGTRIAGIIKFFNTQSGYGFIIRDDGQRDVFVHKKDLQPSLRFQLNKDDKVTFTVVDTDRGPQARELERV